MDRYTVVEEEPRVKTRQELAAREIEELHKTLARRLGDTSVPTLPQVAVRVLDLVSNPNATINDFTEVIKTDQALTGRLLRVANSSAYAQREAVTKVERAMVLLGMDKLKAFALGFHLSKAAGVEDGPVSTRRMWTQSLFRGWLASHIAARFDKRVSGEAFVVAFMADAGLPMMPGLIGSGYLKTVNPSDPPAKHFLTEFATLPFTHVDVAAALCLMWKLPPVLAKPMCAHHSAPPPVNERDPQSIITAAAYYACAVPLDDQGTYVEKAPLASVAQKLFNMDSAALAGVLDSAAKDFVACKDMFSHILDKSLSVDAILDRATLHLGVREDDAAKKDAQSRTRRLTIAGFSIEIEPAPGRGVTAYIADAKGNRLLSEDLSPRSHSEAEVRQLLLLDSATPKEMAEVMDAIRKLAA
ncbi:MAG: HDOD domain-containing protein [Phycisphaerales bacterium]|nr:HDOD domain-containing protein [Phycisphaerales bacterium]